jgi:hypothetical protein
MELFPVSCHEESFQDVTIWNYERKVATTIPYNLKEKVALKEATAIQNNI